MKSQHPVNGVKEPKTLSYQDGRQKMKIGKTAIWLYDDNPYSILMSLGTLFNWSDI